MIDKLETEPMYKDNTLGRQLFEMAQKINELVDAVNGQQALIHHWIKTGVTQTPIEDAEEDEIN